MLRFTLGRKNITMSSKVFLGSTVILVLLVFLFVRIPVIQVSFADQYFYLRDDKFEIGWIHSVEKEPWFETFERNNGKFLLVQTRFKTFGAGTPSEGEIIPSNDGYVHMKIRREINFIELAVSENVQTTLYTKSGAISLYELVENHETVKIEIINLPIWQLLRGEFK